MDKQTHPTLHSRTLPLLPLQSALVAAQRETPSRPPHAPRDADELLALQLIEKIRHPKPMSFEGLQIESPQPLVPESIFEMAGVDA